jgi:hypothetical protein
MSSFGHTRALPIPRKPAVSLAGMTPYLRGGAERCRITLVVDVSTSSKQHQWERKMTSAKERHGVRFTEVWTKGSVPIPSRPKGKAALAVWMQEWQPTYDRAIRRYLDRKVPLPNPVMSSPLLVAYSVSGYTQVILPLCSHPQIREVIESEASIGRAGTGAGDKPLRPRNNVDYTGEDIAQRLIQEYLGIRPDALPLGVNRGSGPAGPHFRPPVASVSVEKSPETLKAEQAERDRLQPRCCRCGRNWSPLSPSCC